MESLENIYKGGLHIIDDYDETSGKLVNLCIPLDYDTIKELKTKTKTKLQKSSKPTRKKIKGSSAYDTKSMVMGDNVLLNLLNVNLEWNAFALHKSRNNEVNYLQNVIKILGLPKNIDNLDDILLILKNIMEMDKEAHITWLSKKFEIYEPIKHGIKSLFWAWKFHLEHLVKVFNASRTKYITDNKTNDKLNNYSSLIEAWSHIDKEYKIDTSSLPLLFLHPPKSPEALPWISSIESKESWDNMPVFHIELNNAPKDIQIVINRFKKALVDNNFTYIGYCDCQPIYRFIALLKFPIRELVECIKIINPSYKIKNYCKLYKSIENIRILDKNISVFEETLSNQNQIKNDLKLKKIKQAHVKNIQPVKIKEKPKKGTIKYKIYKIDKYVVKLLKLYSKLQPELVALESYYVEIALLLNTLTRTISNYLAN